MVDASAKTDCPPTGRSVADCPAIRAEGLCKAYDGVEVISKTSFTVEPGTSAAFVSPSGSGKSTLLSMLGLILTPTSGDVVVGEQGTRDLSDAARSALRGRTVGFVFQHTQLIGSLRAWENVTVPARFVDGGRVADGEARARELLERFGLAERAEHYPYQLSIGQKRRVACARALMLAPPVLIADEPTNDLDADSADSVTRALFEHVERGGILLFATHDAALSAKADRVFHLRDGCFA